MDNQSPPRANSHFPDTIAMGEVDYSNLPYIISLFVLVLSLLIFILWRKTKSARTDILITGLSDAGKTYLFSQLLYSTDKETFSSITTNVGEFSTEQGPIRVVDIPGNERLRNKFLDQYKYLAKAIVFVIDSVAIQKDIRDVADYLYTILSDQGTSSTPVLIVCNKQDVTMAKGEIVVKALLEKELNLVRQTRMNRLQSVDNSSGDEVFLGKTGKDFVFNHLSQDIQFVECSAKSRDLSGIVNWIKKL